jgi:hypothetical protein
MYKALIDIGSRHFESLEDVEAAAELIQAKHKQVEIVI